MNIDDYWTRPPRPTRWWRIRERIALAQYKAREERFKREREREWEMERARWRESGQ